MIVYNQYFKHIQIAVILNIEITKWSPLIFFFFHFYLSDIYDVLFNHCQKNQKLHVQNQRNKYNDQLYLYTFTPKWAGLLKVVHYFFYDTMPVSNKNVKYFKIYLVHLSIVYITKIFQFPLLYPKILSLILDYSTQCDSFW